MAPVGSFESLTAAINAGADAIFFGAEQLNMRSRSAHNFSIDEIVELSNTCKSKSVKAYLTLNTLLYDHDIELMKNIMNQAKACGIDGAIVQDIAGMQYAMEIGLPVHASTQLSISNIDSVRFYSRFCDVIVLARELDLKMIKKITDEIKKDNIKGPSGELVKIEIFVHGALCIAQSGRCHMSLLQNNTSAQRGACLQECRKKYRIIDEETGKEMILDNQYVLSPSDLCTLPFLDQIVDSGVSVLKIEGRGRSPDYADTVVRVYKSALGDIDEKKFTKDKIDSYMNELKKSYNRGFCDGYYLGRSLPVFSGYSGNHATEEKVYVGQISHYFPKSQIAELNLTAHELKIGDEYVIIGVNSGVVKGKITEIKKDDFFVENSGKPSLVTIKVDKKVRKNDKIYLLKKRESNVYA